MIKMRADGEIYVDWLVLVKLWMTQIICQFLTSTLSDEPIKIVL